MKLFTSLLSLVSIFTIESFCVTKPEVAKEIKPKKRDFKTGDSFKYADSAINPDRLGNIDAAWFWESLRYETHAFRMYSKLNPTLKEILVFNDSEVFCTHNRASILKTALLNTNNKQKFYS